MTTIDTQEFRSALGSFTTGVTIVTTRSADGMDVGVTANSFNSVSLDPPMVLWSLAKSSGSYQVFDQAECFAVHILAADQEALSNRFAQRGANKFTGLQIGRGHGDVPLLDGCSARFECKTAYRYEGGDHVILVGEVLTFEHFDRKSLAFLGGRYAETWHRPRPAPSTGQGSTDEISLDFSWLNYLIKRISHQFSLRLRPALRAEGLSESENYALQAVMARNGCTVSELHGWINDPLQPGAELAANLAARGLLHMEKQADGSAFLSLSEAGQHVAIRILAATKSLEGIAESGLDEADIRLLKDCLRRVVRNTDPSLLPLDNK